MMNAGRCAPPYKDAEYREASPSSQEPPKRRSPEYRAKLVLRTTGGRLRRISGTGGTGGFSRLFAEYRGRGKAGLRLHGPACGFKRGQRRKSTCRAGVAAKHSFRCALEAANSAPGKHFPRGPAGVPAPCGAPAGQDGGTLSTAKAGVPAKISAEYRT